MGFAGYLLLLLGVVLVALVATAVGVLISYQHKTYRARVVALAAWAHQQGWQYVERDLVLIARFARFAGKPFGLGQGGEARHVLAGPFRGRMMVAFEYRYSVTVSYGETTSSNTYQHLVVAVGTPAHRPMVEVGWRGLGRDLLGSARVRDLALPNDTFSRTFQVRAEDPMFAYDVLSHGSMEWMLADQRTRSWPFRFQGAELLTWAKGDLEPHRVVWMLDYLSDVLDRVPGFVWSG